MKFVLLFLFSLFPTLLCITLEQLSLQQPNLTDPFVQVQGESINISDDDTWTQKYFLVKVIGKNKKTTYQSLIARIKRISNHLKKKLILPSQKFLIATRIQSKYLTKRQCWSFSQIILMYAKDEDAVGVETTFKQSHIDGIDTHANLEQFQQKFQVIRAFYDAKMKIINKIKQFKDIQIDDVVNINILTPNLDAQVDELQYISQLEDSSDQHDQQQRESSKPRHREAKKIEKKNIKIKAIFKLELDWQSDDHENQITFQNQNNEIQQNDL